MSAEFSSTGLYLVYLQLLRKTAAGRVVSVTQQPGLVHFKFRTSLLLPQCVLSALIDSAAAEQQPAQCCSAADSSSADSLSANDDGDLRVHDWEISYPIYR